MRRWPNPCRDYSCRFSSLSTWLETKAAPSDPQFATLQEEDNLNGQLKSDMFVGCYQPYYTNLERTFSTIPPGAVQLFAPLASRIVTG